MIKIICECGVNFSNLHEAKKMIDKSKEIDAFLCKFQIYNNKTIKDSKNQEFLKAIMINKEIAKTLFEYGKKIGQEIFFSTMIPESIDWCEEIGVGYYKIRFYDRNNLILYRKVKKTKVPIFVSCNDPNDTIYSNIAQYQKRVKFLYCVPDYPAELGKYRPDMLWKNFSGISDHTRDLKLFRMLKDSDQLDYFEMHMKLKDTIPLESIWSKTFEEVKEVL